MYIVCTPATSTIPPSFAVATADESDWSSGHRIKPRAKVLLVACQQKEKLVEIVVIAEDPLVVLATVHNVVTHFIDPRLPAKGARHRQIPPRIVLKRVFAG
jgi:hypothetical protein